MNRNTKYLILSTSKFGDSLLPFHMRTRRANENFVVPWRNRGAGLGFRKVSIARQGFSAEEKGRMAAAQEKRALVSLAPSFFPESLPPRPPPPASRRHLAPVVARLVVEGIASLRRFRSI